MVEVFFPASTRRSGLLCVCISLRQSFANRVENTISNSWVCLLSRNSYSLLREYMFIQPLTRDELCSVFHIRDNSLLECRYHGYVSKGSIKTHSNGVFYYHENVPREAPPGGCAGSSLQASRHIAPSLRLFVPNSLTVYHRFFSSEGSAHDILWLGIFFFPRCQSLPPLPL
jgi:hypothetical protein